MKVQCSKDWLPTPDNINKLPLPIREYIHDLECGRSSADLIQENAALRQLNKELMCYLKQNEED